MRSYSTSSIDFDLVFQGPDSVEEYNTKAGARPTGVPAVVEDAVAGLIAWDTLPEWQAAFVKELGNKYPDFKREVNEKATEVKKAAAVSPEAKEKAIVYETITKSVKRFLAGKSDEEKKELATLAQTVADKIAVDPSPSKRHGAPKKDTLMKADTWLALSEDELESKITNAANAGVNVDLIVRDEAGRPERDSLARFIGAYIDLLNSQV